MAEREKEVIVTNDGGGGGMILAVVLLLAIIVGLFFVFGGNFLNDAKTTKIDADVTVDTPVTDNK